MQQNKTKPKNFLNLCYLTVPESWAQYLAGIRMTWKQKRSAEVWKPFFLISPHEGKALCPAHWTLPAETIAQQTGVASMWPNTLECPDSGTSLHYTKATSARNTWWLASNTINYYRSWLGNKQPERTLVLWFYRLKHIFQLKLVAYWWEILKKTHAGHI